jgi:hypothetical protein
MMPIKEEEVNMWKEVTMKFALKPRKATTNANKNNRLQSRDSNVFE